MKNKTTSRKPPARPDVCRKCRSRCCRYLCFEIDRPESYEDFENARWFLMHKGVSIHIEENGDWYMAITNRCRNLTRDNLCRDYDNRPLICRSYSVEGCDFTKGDYEYSMLFKTPRQLEDYARKQLGEAVFRRGRARALAAAGGRKR
jgi:Fe-S-cluster containining protein